MQTSDQNNKTKTITNPRRKLANIANTAQTQVYSQCRRYLKRFKQSLTNKLVAQMNTKIDIIGKTDKSVYKL